ncbi:MAG: signal recognition particle-docking protein FtsY [Dehalococcoidia bacterium]|nr:signal recognition particle-docking protein FtsY [Dehalococcoidia bacterium]
MLNFLNRNKQEVRSKTREGTQKSRLAWLGPIMRIVRSGRPQEILWEDLEEVLISADIGVETSIDLIENLKKHCSQESLTDSEKIIEALKSMLFTCLTHPPLEDYLSTRGTSRSSPYVILVVGVNGVGKTTTIAKLAHYYKNMGNKVILAAADTFRAAAIEQLQLHGSAIGVDVIAHRHGADPGAVAFDAYQASNARSADILIIDTAGRLHTKTNLMKEMIKIKSVITKLDNSAPHETLLVLDATTGVNGLDQAKSFTKTVQCQGVILSKMDGTSRGGIAIPIQRELNLPILYLGTGESIEDLVGFDAWEFIEALLGPVN